MAEGKLITLGELFARKEREIREYQASPEGQAAWKSLEEKMAEESRMRAIQTAGEDAAIAGLAGTECPYPPDTREGRLWVYGFENPPSDDGEEENDEGTDEETD